mmetsp:Transcript_24373/g.37551  ORF Transcript_24373/g.37551 Transcript_24373/m.37551 type:complete len:259 (-) Transcript_24373:305-1081(-)|eukprot:CAMPEP_0195287826 /NCGR_PEP_ID=MMETSP0707-20130614/4736_1 /TAXON_ID=33640 /ORGANISM="Asterionellopsis glacialis, Strain CCMP134" /LENGTH=258 /DNA_ID=CAMNT_0040347623 /DNA_START=202 /DNA_END=978 /DNA_ORIENTATION=-
MARPEEMAQNMMNKWVRMKEKGNSTFTPLSNQKRPHLAIQCDHLKDAEFWRRQILREITAGIGKIQNPGLDEHTVRDINDDINKKFREKYHWNKRIHELGGPDYNALEKKQQVVAAGTEDSSSLRGSDGYRYFGAAKDLPGVKELFQKHALRMAKRKRGDYSHITTDYYGWRDEEDGVLVELEQEALLSSSSSSKRSKSGANHNKMNDSDDDDDDDSDYGGDAVSYSADYLAAVPTQQMVEQAILEKKKKELLARLTM